MWGIYAEKEMCAQKKRERVEGGLKKITDQLMQCNNYPAKSLGISPDT